MKTNQFLMYILSLLMLPALTVHSQDFLLKSGATPTRSTDNSRFTLTATVMDNDTWCRVEWPEPAGYYPELWYDDGEADDYFVWADAGYINALKFITYFDNFIVTGGSIYVGDGSFPGPFLGTSCLIMVLDDDGAYGLPGSVVDSTDITVNNYGWVEFEGLTAEFAEGDFYLAMKQLAPSPDAAPVGVDTDNPTYFRSYTNFSDSGWMLAPLQDFMIRATVMAFNEPAREMDSFEITRFADFELNETPLMGEPLILDTVSVSEYADYEWDGIDNGLYAYGVRTHFSNGQWSDFDVSNIVLHHFYAFPPSCFYQADMGNQPLIICPPYDLNGALPNYFLGYNVYVAEGFADFLPPSATSYQPVVGQPGIYNCNLTAVYDLSSFDYPNETGESMPLTAYYTMRQGFSLPFLEQWNYGNFDINNWTVDGPNWSLTGQEGSPAPAAQFTWDPIQTDYQVALESYPLQADSLIEGSIYLDFLLKLDDVEPTGNEKMLVQVWNWNTQAWATVSTYTNTDGSFDWISEHLDITDQAINTVFKIRFAATGDNSLNILAWYVDNIHVYRECNPPENLESFISWSWEGILLSWDLPYEPDHWIQWDDGINSGNSVGTGEEVEFDASLRWTPDLLDDYDGFEVTEVSFFPAEEQAEYSIRIWTGPDASNMVIKQMVPNPVIGQWNMVILETPVAIDISQELWIGYHVNTLTGYPAGVDDGPAIDGFGNMMNFGGWQTLLEINPDLDYNWNIKAFVHEIENSQNPERYAIYRQDNDDPYFLRAYSDTNFYVDDSICGGNIGLHGYKVSALYITDNDTCESGFSNEAYEICVGMEELKDDVSLRIYPNPASDVLFIESSEKVESIRIFDGRGAQVVEWSGGQVLRWSSGRVVRWSGGQEKVGIPLEGLAPGIYLVRVETAGGVVAKKVVVGR